MSYFYRLYSLLYVTSNEITENLYFGLVDQFDDLFLVITALYFAIIAILWIQNKLGDFANEFITSAILAAFLFEAIVGSRAYWDTGIILFVDTPYSLSEFIASLTGSGRNDIFSMINDAQQSAMTMLFSVSDNASIFKFSSFGLWIGGWILVLAMSTLSVSFFCFMLLSVFGVRIMLIAGIVAVFLASFKMTRHIFWAWLKSIMSYALLQVFAVLIIGIVINIIVNLMDMLAAVDIAKYGLASETYFGALIVIAIGIWLLWKASEFSSALTGGVMASLGGAGQQMAQVGQMGARTYQNTMAGGVNKAASGGWSAAKSGGRMLGTGGLSAYKKMRGIKQ